MKGRVQGKGFIIQVLVLISLPLLAWIGFQIYLYIRWPGGLTTPGLRWLLTLLLIAAPFLITLVLPSAQLIRATFTKGEIPEDKPSLAWQSSLFRILIWLGVAVVFSIVLLAFVIVITMVISPGGKATRTAASERDLQSTLLLLYFIALLPGSIVAGVILKRRNAAIRVLVTTSGIFMAGVALFAAGALYYSGARFVVEGAITARVWSFGDDRERAVSLCQNPEMGDSPAQPQGRVIVVDAETGELMEAHYLVNSEVRAENLDDADVVVCIERETEIIQTCQYEQGVTITRARSNYQARAIDTSTWQLIETITFIGTEPSEKCPDETTGTRWIEGPPPTAPNVAFWAGSQATPE